VSDALKRRGHNRTEAPLSDPLPSGFSSRLRHLRRHQQQQQDGTTGASNSRERNKALALRREKERAGSTGDVPGQGLSRTYDPNKYHHNNNNNTHTQQASHSTRPRSMPHNTHAQTMQHLSHSNTYPPPDMKSPNSPFGLHKKHIHSPDRCVCVCVYNRKLCLVYTHTHTRAHTHTHTHKQCRHHLSSSPSACSWWSLLLRSCGSLIHHVCGHATQSQCEE